MGLILFWIYDRSPRQIKTQQLFEKTISIVVNLIKLSSFPLLRPIRRIATNLLEIVYGDDGTLSPEASS